MDCGIFYIDNHVVDKYRLFYFFLLLLFFCPRRDTFAVEGSIQSLPFSGMLDTCFWNLHFIITFEEVPFLLLLC
jgi:hypothetical protein